jgi:hypothetical protein
MERLCGYILRSFELDCGRTAFNVSNLLFVYLATLSARGWAGAVTGMH